jgi:hypothetical protein
MSGAVIGWLGSIRATVKPSVDVLLGTGYATGPDWDRPPSS